MNERGGAGRGDSVHLTSPYNSMLCCVSNCSYHLSLYNTITASLTVFSVLCLLFSLLIPHSLLGSLILKRLNLLVSRNLMCIKLLTKADKWTLYHTLVYIQSVLWFYDFDIFMWFLVHSHLLEWYSESCFPSWSVQGEGTMTSFVKN